MTNPSPALPPATPPPGSAQNPRAPLDSRTMLARYRDSGGRGGITVIQKTIPGADHTPHQPPHGGAWAARALPRLRQRWVNFNVDVADVNQLVAGRFASFSASRVYLTVFAGVAGPDPLPPVVAQQTHEVIGVNHGLSLSTTVRQASGLTGFVNTWTVWLQVNGLYQPWVLREPERRTLLVWCVLPVARG